MCIECYILVYYAEKVTGEEGGGSGRWGGGGGGGFSHYRLNAFIIYDTKMLSFVNLLGDFELNNSLYLSVFGLR